MSKPTKNYRNLKPTDKGYRKCSMPDCPDHAYYKKAGLCSRHYIQVRRHGKTFVSKFDKNDIVFYKDYAEIILCDESGNEIARTKVSLNRLPLVSNYKWCLKDKDGLSVKSSCTELGENIALHRLIMGVIDQPKIEVSHKNKDRLDNRDQNLRLLTHAQSLQAAKNYTNNTSGIKGVGWLGKRKRWRAYITVEGNRIELGLFVRKRDAIRIRQAAEKKYFTAVLD